MDFLTVFPSSHGFMTNKYGVTVSEPWAQREILGSPEDGNRAIFQNTMDLNKKCVAGRRPSGKS
jgi:hypothetical protein